jgi:hypothetical protein
MTILFEFKYLRHCRAPTRQSNRADYRRQESDVLAVWILPQPDGCQRVQTKHPKLNRTAVRLSRVIACPRPSALFIVAQEYDRVLPPCLYSISVTST